MTTFQVSSQLSIFDRLGALMVRLSFNRSDYAVEPGLYALNNPTSESPVFVSANYKLSFDIVRSSLAGFGAWLLVLDTKGVNVWCAAGKGTFGTVELVNRIRLTELEKVVSHRKVISPQLGGTGIAAHEVLKQSGFQVIYGPVRAEDLPAFIKDHFKVTQEMRQVRFNFIDRLTLVPVELVSYSKYLFLLLLLFFLLSRIDQSSVLIPSLNVIAAYLCGTVFGPALLPWLPGRSFALKGALLGLLAFALTSYSLPWLDLLAWLLIMPTISSFLLMNFTGSSTYTSLSGVQKEMRVAVPLQIAGLTLGTIIYISARVVG
ncbi:acetyl-CoA synthase subunit gamma [Candidatus Saganbacteria bacterium CG08_land_8_20_14_0_20_45_16]|uniref:Acetyl-CoA synthase subunit gamma n=1 Tax=Candidatus Saganbacteria bacterium CG08_land_8_20_14_0_20_45_16 TaxID=2014293 RepID=A0A2H0XVT2_UNCSA|nr:MAG: acetyl-CoA synthase subunit gamma [Candidatus Saganbacteria bacterium CG08_land_8_20_14_0_20_45_16]